MDISRHFVTLGSRQIHYRRAGAGPPVVLLHQSPTTSRDCEPLMRKLLGRHTVFAPDMPGYGASDPLPQRDLTIEMLADNLAAFMDAVGIDMAGIYGFHTGASIATAFARRHARRVSVSVAVGLLCLTPPERDELLQQYAPPITPRWDGSHLAWLWSRIKDQSVFFPWFARTADARVSMDGSSPAIIQASAVDWLRSGERYRDAYEAAFRYRPELDLPHITTPQVIAAFATDPLFTHLDRLPAVSSPVEIVRCTTVADAQDVAADRLGRFSSRSAAPAAIPALPPADRGWQDYVTVGGVQLRLLRGSAVQGRPVLLQHGAQSSVRSCGSLIETLGGSRSVFALELPGHGESDPWPDAAKYTVADLSDLLGDAVKALGISEVELIGWEAGAAIQVAFAARGSIRIDSIALISPLDVTPQPPLQDQMLDSYPEAVYPDFFGGHLLRAWHAARDHLLFFPWYERRRDCAGVGDPRLNADFVHQAAVDGLLAGTSGFAVRRAEIRYPLLAHLAALRCPIRFAAPRWSPRFLHARSLAACAGRGLLELPPDPHDWGAILTG